MTAITFAGDLSQMGTFLTGERRSSEAIPLIGKVMNCPAFFGIGELDEGTHGDLGRKEMATQYKLHGSCQVSFLRIIIELSDRRGNIRVGGCKLCLRIAGGLLITG